jgi:hypothetical protein
MKIYELKNTEGCHFASAEARSLRKARAIFEKSYCGRFLIEGNDGSYMYVNL